MKLAVADSIVKGVCRVTDSVIAAKESIYKMERTIPPQLTAAPSHTSQHQLHVSLHEIIVPDYKLFQIEANGESIAITVIEVRTNEQFNDGGVCQTIGYHAASRAHRHR